jgi:L-2-hydroxyglutarate oxidase LhgO
LDRVECVVVGAGVVGLAIARRLARSGREVLLLEAADEFGTEASSRNSEVVHAGLYYPSDWLKTRLCVAGRPQLYDFCAEHNVPFQRLGKLIVATDEAERGTLARIHAQALENGVDSIRPLGADEIAELEPEVRAVAGLFSPETGILDSHQLMLALLGELEEAGGAAVFRSPVVAGRVTGGGLEIDVDCDPATSLACDVLVNSAGLHAQTLAARIEGLPAAEVPGRYLAKGQYYGLRGRSPFRRLVYPVPVAGGLGVHLTLDLGGRARFGPDVHWQEDIDYAFDESVMEAVGTAIRRYYPGLDPARLEPGYTGIRTKLSGPGEAGVDFRIDGPDRHGVPGLVNLFGIESPGLTACLAIADYVAGLLAGEPADRA